MVKRSKTKGPKEAGARTTSNGAVSDSVNITPTPKILKVLGQIEFDPWQCIAELVDNSFDEFLEIEREGTAPIEALEVTVTLPPASPLFTFEEPPPPTVVVSDNGRGMTLAQIKNAATAGWSANDPFSKLGLFGMGFNVATARLGQVTRLLTTRSGDAEWVGIEIDLDKLTPDFMAPVVRQPKTTRSEHGTRVEISNLDRRADWLTRPANQSRLRETLGGIYSYLLDTKGYRLIVSGVPVKPIRHCVWDESRFVTRGKEVIPAVIRIDEPLADRAVCHACLTWQSLDNRVCDECGNDHLEVRERRGWGWVGIQRYLHTKEYGLDFLRNGRKILRFDKTVFQWRDPDDPSGQGDVEYPIELAHQGGRIVGEIHVDHVPVNYLKNHFETSDQGWRKATEIVRGSAPLLPREARRLGMENNSPLARLHRGFRRNDPGRNYLMPGNGKTVLDTNDWGKLFRQGAADYQDDSKWWEAVVRHDQLVEEAKSAKANHERSVSEAIADPTEEFRQPAELSRDAEANPAPNEPPITEADRVDALLASSRGYPELDGQFSAQGVAGRPIKVTTYVVSGTEVRTPEGVRAPVWLAPIRGGSFAAFIDTSHAHFSTFDDDPADVVLMEIAQHLLARSQGTARPISAVFADLKQRYLTSRTIDPSRLVAQATDLLRILQRRMVQCVTENPERPWQNVLNDYERHFTQDRIAEVEKTDDIAKVVNAGRYILYVPPGIVPRIVEEWPEAFFDGRLFAGPYHNLGSSSARRQAVATITGFLNDISWLAAAPPIWNRDLLIRAQLSLQLLPDELVSMDDD